MDIKTDEADRRIKDEKEAALEARRASMVKRCDSKIARRRSQAERREAILAEELSRAQAADEAKREVELAHRLAAELSRRRSKHLSYPSGIIHLKIYDYIPIASFLLALHCASW